MDHVVVANFAVVFGAALVDVVMVVAAYATVVRLGRALGLPYPVTLPPVPQSGLDNQQGLAQSWSDPA
jgi:hypothetical protein